MDANDIVFAKTTSHVTSPQGHMVLVVLGGHWPKNDPIVLAYPDCFSTDPVYGISFTQKPIVAEPAVLSDTPPASKPNLPKVESTTANPGEPRGVPKK